VTDMQVVILANTWKKRHSMRSGIGSTLRQATQVTSVTLARSLAYQVVGRRRPHTTGLMSHFDLGILAPTFVF
jgi:hypothetical protein